MRTKRTGWIAITAISALLFTACQKEVDFQNAGNGPGNNPGPNNPGGGGNTGSIVGQYDFIGLWSKQSNSVTTSEQGMELKLVAQTEYESENNTGGLNITDTKFSFIQIGHTVNGMVTLYSYLDGIPFGQQTEVFNEVTDPTDQEYDYVRNSADSVTFTDGFASIPDPSGGSTPMPTGPIGAKINLSNDTLYIATRFKYTFDQSQQGVSAKLGIDAEGVMRFKKK